MKSKYTVESATEALRKKKDIHVDKYGTVYVNRSESSSDSLGNKSQGMIDYLKQFHGIVVEVRTSRGWKTVLNIR